MYRVTRRYRTFQLSPFTLLAGGTTRALKGFAKTIIMGARAASSNKTAPFLIVGQCPRGNMTASNASVESDWLYSFRSDRARLLYWSARLYVANSVLSRREYRSARAAHCLGTDAARDEAARPLSVPPCRPTAKVEIHYRQRGIPRRRGLFLAFFSARYA